MSALNAAFKVLSEEGRAMSVKEIYETAVERGYCKGNNHQFYFFDNATSALSLFLPFSKSQWKMLSF
jgi:RAB protein geranylgeranyltransferase component A